TGFGFSTGDSYGPFGFELAGLYRTEYQTIPDETLVQYRNAGTPEKPDIRAFERFTTDNGLFTTRLGGLFTSTYKLADNQKLFFLSLIDRNTFDDTLGTPGANNQNHPEQNSILRYTANDPALGQLRGVNP